MKLSGLNAIITGGSQGLGKTIAGEFLREGASVVICARDAVLLSETRAELAASGGQVFAHACDVSDEKQIAELTAFALRELGTVDILVCNAGVYGPMGSTEEVDIHEWKRALEINLYGTLLPCRALIPHFKRAAKGKIVIVSGGGATSPLPNISSYAASKAAVVRLMETLAGELKPWRIDVNAFAPGALKTRMMDQVLAAGSETVGEAFFEKNRKWAAGGATPLALGAGLCVYLASAESDGITGRLISAQWDQWPSLHEHRDELANSDIYCIRRIVPEDRGLQWSPES